MTAEQVQEVAVVTPELAELKELKKAGKFWEIFAKVKPILQLIVTTAWFLPQKIKDAVQALLLAGEAFEQSAVTDTKKVTTAKTPAPPKVKKETAKEKKAREKAEAALQQAKENTVAATA